MHTGTVKFWHDDKGWGFIKRDDSGAEYFVHYTGIIGQRGRRTLGKGDHVRFDIEENERAVAVEVIEGAAA